MPNSWTIYLVPGLPSASAVQVPIRTAKHTWHHAYKRTRDRFNGKYCQ